MSGTGVRENLVIGGGLAGAMAAVRLAVAGREVVLLEKERGAHHKVCGEFLSPEAVGYLRQSGVDPVRLGAATVERLRFSAKDKVVETQLPFRALSLSRCVLDQALLARAAETRCDIRRGTAVQRLGREGGLWAVELADGAVERAHNVFLASGKHDLRGWARPAGKQGDLVGFKMHFRLRGQETESLRGFMDLFLFAGGYGGLALVENDAANLCVVIRRARLRQLGDWGALVRAMCGENTLLAQRLDGAAALWERPLAISSIPYGYLAESCEDVWRLGDQAAVIPSFTGDGMAIALHSGALAAEMFLAAKRPGEFHRALRTQLRRGISVATLLSRAMVSRVGQAIAPVVAPVLPIALIAGMTRIPREALLSAVDDGRAIRPLAAPHPTMRMD